MTEQHPNADASHWRFSFLQDLRETGNVSAAARHVGKSRAALYRARKQDAAPQPRPITSLAAPIEERAHDTEPARFNRWNYPPRGWAGAGRSGAG